jgi:NTE family protein
MPAARVAFVPPNSFTVPPPRSPHRRGFGLTELSSRLPKPITYVLAGGGAHGCVQWGLLQALAETDIKPDALIGTSAGALSGSIFAEDPVSGVNRLAYVWSQLDLQALIGDGWLSIVRSATSRKSGLAENTALREAIEGILEVRTFADLKLPFAAVSTDLASGLAIALDDGPIVPALLASSAIPGVLPPVKIHGRYYVDGLASANLPTQLAVRRGAGSIIALDTGSRAPAELSTSAAKVVARVSNILGATQRRSQLTAAARHVPVVLIPTPGDLGGTLDFGSTIEVAGRAYVMARQFLDTLAETLPARVEPGLYAPPEELRLDTEVLEVLRPVTL